MNNTPTHTTPDELETWVTGIIAKRPTDAIIVLSHLLKAGIRNGQTSAADIPSALDFEEPNIIGSIFRVLPRCGFYKDRSQYVKMKDKKKHGRDVPVWVLDERWKAEFVLERIKKAILGVVPQQAEMQLTM